MGRTIADLIEDRFGIESQAGSDMPAHGALAAILTRRVTRRFKPDPIPDAVLDVAMAGALSAPSKSDLQQCALVVLNDKAKQAAIASWIPSMPWIAQAPRFLVFCGDNRRLRRIAELRGKPFPNDNLDQFMNCAVDAGLVLATFVLAAQAVGLGCCPISVIRDHISKVTRLLELPPGVFPVAGLCVGSPENHGTISMRLPPAVTVHVDRYRDDDLPQQIDAYDRRRAVREPIAREKQRHAERYGELDSYGWSEDKARQYSVPERADFGAFIRAHGFALS